MKIEVQNACFSYNSEPLLMNINLKVSEGQVLCILGANGSGKSTLLKCICGFEKWQKGGTQIEGKSALTTGEKEFWKKIACVPQVIKPVFSLTVLEMVMMGRNVHLGKFGSPKREDEEIAQWALEQCKIADLQYKDCFHLSGGEFRLVMLARALCAKPEILILDEIETSLDIKNQMKIMRLIRELSEKGLGVIMTTHFPQNAVFFVQKAMLLKKGEEPHFANGNEIINEENLCWTFGIKSLMIN